MCAGHRVPGTAARRARTLVRNRRTPCDPNPYACKCLRIKPLCASPRETRRGDAPLLFSADVVRACGPAAGVLETLNGYFWSERRRRRRQRRRWWWGRRWWRRQGPAQQAQHDGQPLRPGSGKQPPQEVRPRTLHAPRCNRAGARFPRHRRLHPRTRPGTAEHVPSLYVDTHASTRGQQKHAHMRSHEHMRARYDTESELLVSPSRYACAKARRRPRTPSARRPTPARAAPEGSGMIVIVHSSGSTVPVVVNPLPAT